MKHFKIIERGARVSHPLELSPGNYMVLSEGTRDGVALRIGHQLFQIVDLNVIELEGGGMATAELVNTGPETDAAIYLAKLEPVAGAV